MRRSHRLIGLPVAVLACVGTMAACSSSDDDPPPLSNDDAVVVLQEQGYTAEGAQCLIDGAKLQNVDMHEFLTRSKYTQREADVVQTVGAFCVDKYGSTDTTTATTG